MKLLTAVEARGLNKTDDDQISQIIALINNRIKLRSAAGHVSAAIGYDEETRAWIELRPVDQQNLIGVLERAGFYVLSGWECAITISWENLEKLDE